MAKKSKRPMFGFGQRQKPVDAETKANDQDKLGGCGNPLCTMCNHHTADRRGASAIGKEVNGSSAGKPETPPTVTGKVEAAPTRQRLVEKIFSYRYTHRFKQLANTVNYDLKRLYDRLMYECTFDELDSLIYQLQAQSLVEKVRFTAPNPFIGNEDNEIDTAKFAVNMIQTEQSKARLEQFTPAFLGVDMATSKPSEPKGPPRSYTDALDDVEDYLCDAPDQAFDDVIGNEAALAQLRDAITAPVEHAELYKAYGMKAPKGAMLYGPPGCGKTMFARAMASQMKKLHGGDVKFLSIAATELLDSYVGETEKRIAELFTFATEYKKYHGHPLLIFIDEAEVLLPDRTGSARRIAPWEQRQVATFLAKMDGIEESGAFILLATNRPEMIDQALLRDGRCDFKVKIERPSITDVEEILRRNFEGCPCGENALEDLVFAAGETFMDPNLIILPGKLLKRKVNGKKRVSKDAHFMLRHIASGAMAASVPERAKRIAFARDKTRGKVSGVTVEDVVEAVTGIFEENKDLDHSMSLMEFVQNELAKADAADRKNMN